MTRRSCLSCGGPITNATASREDAVPVWLQKHLGISNALVEPTLQDPSGNILAKRAHPVDQLRTGSICRSCNNVWMSQLENDAAPVLKELIGGVRTLESLTRNERRLVGRWAAKTAFALDAGNHQRFVPPVHFRELNDRRDRLPSRVAVFAHSHQPTQQWSYLESSYWNHGRLTPCAKAVVEESSYKVALQFGHLILVVAYWPLRGWAYRVEKGMVFTVWPTNVNPIPYVHPSPMTANTSEDLCARLAISINIAPTHRAKGRT